MKLMNLDGTLLQMKAKNDLLISLKSLVCINALTEDASSTCSEDNFLVIDGMAVVQAVMHAKKFVNYSEMSVAVVHFIDKILNEHEGGRVIFDNYAKKLPLKDMLRYGSPKKKS